MCYRIYRFRELERFRAFFVDIFFPKHHQTTRKTYGLEKKMNEAKTNTEHKKQVILSIWVAFINYMFSKKKIVPAPRSAGRVLHRLRDLRGLLLRVRAHDLGEVRHAVQVLKAPLWHRNPGGKPWEIHGKSTKNDGNPWENPPKMVENHGKSLGKMLEQGGWMIVWS